MPFRLIEASGRARWSLNGELCSNSRFRKRWKRKDFVELAIQKLHCDLNATDAMFAGEIDRALRVLKVVAFEGVSRPVPQAAEVKLGAHVLQ